MADMKLFIELMARSTGLKRELNESEKGFQRFGSVARREMASIKQVAGSVQGQLAALGLSVGMLQQLSQSAHLDKGLTQVKQTAGETGDVVKGLRKEFFEMSRQTGRDVDSIKNGFDSLIQSGQSWRAALESTKGINIANAVTHVDENTLAGGLTVGATAYNIDLEKPGQALVLLDKMTAAGRLGNAELGNLSDIFARVGVNAASANMGFDKTLAFIEALSQIERQPERLATLADSTLRVFTNLRYMREAQKGTGVKFFDAKNARRDTVEVLKDIKGKWDKLKTDRDRAVFIQRAFGKADLDTIKGIRTLLQGDALTKISDFTTKIGNAGGTLQKDLPEAISNAVDQGARLKSVLRQASDEFAQPINKAIADFIKLNLDKKSEGGKELTGKQIIGGTAAIIAGSYVMSKVGKSALGNIAGRLLSQGTSTAIGVAEGKALEAAAGVTPVFVTNWPGSGVPVPGIPTPGGIPTGTGGKDLAKKGVRWLGRSALGTAAYELLPYLGAGAGGYALGTVLNHGLGAVSEWSSGGKYKGPGWMGEQIYDALHPERFDMKYASAVENARSRQAQNYINLQVQIDSQGRVFSRSDNNNTYFKKIDQRGDFFQALTNTEAM